MSEVFPFSRRIRPTREGFAPRRIDLQTEAGGWVRRSLDTTPPFMSTLLLLCTDSGATTSLAYWRTFLLAHMDGTTFRFKASRPAYREVSGESIGTSAGGSGESFALDKRYVDSTTLVVYVGGVDQTGDWSLSGNDSAPSVDTGAGFDAGAVTADYEYYFPCALTDTAYLGSILGLGTDLATPGIDEIPVSLAEISPGAHLV